MAQNTIVLKGKLGRRYEEARCSVAAKPGYLMQMSLTSDAGKVRPHATSGGKSTRLFMVEDDLQGLTIDDTYAIDSLGRMVYAEPGDVINAVLKGGQNVAANALLISNGDGTLIVAPTSAGETTDNVVGRVITALNLTALSDDFCPIIVI